MRKVLMISPYFPPRRRVGSLRPFKFSIHLKKFGWEPVILTISEKKNSLTASERDFLKDIKILEINPPFDRTSVKGKSAVKPDKVKARSVLSKIAGWVDKQTPVDSWIFLFWLKYLSIYNRVRNMNPDLIWSTGDPWSGHWLGKKLSEDFGKPWVADFRDPWTLSDITLRPRSPFSEEWDRRLEKAVISSADKLVFTSKATEQIYSDHYGLPEEKTATICNSFEQEMLSVNNKSEWNSGFDQGKLNVVFFGVFRRLSPAAPVAVALGRLREIDPIVTGSIRIHSFGELEAQDLMLIRDLKLESVFFQHRPVVPETTMAVLKSADLLLVSTHPVRKDIIPAKLWDYLASGQPVLSIAPNPEIAEILSKTGAGIQVAPGKTEEIASVLKQCAEEKKNGKKILSIRGNSFENRNLYSAKETTKQLASLFDELIEPW